jgi:dolichol-phosphate mannosyltransferase
MNTAISELTVVVPTRDEAENVSPLLDRLLTMCPDLSMEILFVDDSSDATPRVINERAQSSCRPVRLIHRPPDQRNGGLGGAVCEGLRMARSEWVCVMDADLQHPPELLEALVDEARTSKADLVVASRYCRGGDTGQFSPPRKAASRSSAWFARALFPRRLRGISDPMSGFFLVRRATVDVGVLRPRGFKILLEILLSGSPFATSEVGYRFGPRHAGESKASLLEGVRYVRRVIELRARRRRVEPARPTPVARSLRPVAVSAAQPQPAASVLREAVREHITTYVREVP